MLDTYQSWLNKQRLNKGNVFLFQTFSKLQSAYLSTDFVSQACVWGASILYRHGLVFHLIHSLFRSVLTVWKCSQGTLLGPYFHVGDLKKALGFWLQICHGHLGSESVDEGSASPSLHKPAFPVKINIYGFLSRKLESGTRVENQTQIFCCGMASGLNHYVGQLLPSLLFTHKVLCPGLRKLSSSPRDLILFIDLAVPKVKSLDHP